MSYTETQWTLGDNARLDLEIIDAAGTPIDPETLTLKIKPPGATALQTITNPTKTATGIYHHDLPLDKKGTWYYRWESTAPLPAAAEGSLTVQPSRFTVS